MQAKAAAPAQSTDTPFAEPAAAAAKQPPPAAGEAAEDAEHSGDLEKSNSASTLAPSLSMVKSEFGESDSGVTLSYILPHEPTSHSTHSHWVCFCSIMCMQ